MTPLDARTATAEDSMMGERLIDIVESLVAETHDMRAPASHVAMDSQFERDLGFDSLTRAELLSRIEQAYATRLPVEMFASAVTLGDVLQVLRHAAPATPPNATPARRETSLVAQARIDEPRSARSLGEALQWHAIHHADRVHLILLDDEFRETRITFAELFHRAREHAAGLQERGIGPGDVIALMLPTGSDYFVCFMAIVLCGAVPVPIYPPARATQLEEHIVRHTAILENARAKALITFGELGVLGSLLRARVSTLREVLVPGQIESRETRQWFVAGSDDVALLQYTSGSTGEPKGVVLTHANLLANIRAMGDRMRVDSNDVLVSWLPLYHDMGLIGAWLAPLYYGLPVVVTSPLAFLARPERWLRMISRYHGTITAAPNFAYARCAARLGREALEGLELSSLRFAFCGAEPVSPDSLRAFANRFAGYGFDARALAPVYGLAENALAVTFPPPLRGLRTDRVVRDLLSERGEAKPAKHDEDATELAACGYALHGTELRIVGENGEVLDERHIGRIEFRGNAATRGYLRNEVQTARLIHDGWLDTGDLGYLAQGELYVTGRLKDMIIRAGRHFFPYELEEAIGKLPGVAQGGVAVCGRPDAQGGTERLVIIVETTSTDEAARTLLKTRINEATVVCFGAPAEEIALVPPDTILKTPGGKIRHAATLERFEERGQATTRLSLSRQWVHIAAGSLALACRDLAARSARILRGLACGSAVLLLGLWVRCQVAFSSDTGRNWRIAARACRLFLRVAGVRVTLDGERTTLLDTRPIFAANHTSYLDVIVLTAALPWPVNFVAKRELSDRMFVGPILRRLGTRFVERDVFSGSVADETQLVRHASEGDSLFFFPEGTFVRSAGVREFHLGAFRAACVTQRPVAPVVLRGTRAVLRDGDWIPRPGPVTVSVFAPIAPAGADFSAAARMRDAVRDVIVQHSGEPDTTR
ncbi:AMP-binding protein [Caballeronia sp. AZ1_KS37]|uniref:AMP-binding protein n=1 Tax=Caballeronia sp. AZ1_KS37 TaxID=2921756 RepID=UPI0020291240|nr:AMP-binding protein [Caballeronia sp. AZ1_KS37]